MGVFVFDAVCAEGNGKLCPYPPLLFSSSSFLSLIQIKFLMGFIGPTME